MKTVFLTRRFFPEIGGVERHSLEVAKRLIQHGHEVKVVSEFTPTLNNNKKINYQSSSKSAKLHQCKEQPVKSSYSDHFEIKNIEVFKFNLGSSEFFKKFKIWWYLLRNIKVILQADIVHCHDVFIWYLPFRFLLPWKKVYVTFHGYENFPLKKRQIFLHRLSQVLSNGNIAVGRFIEKWYGTKSDFITYGGVDRSGVLPKKNALGAKEIKILFLGRCEADTGVFEYVKILKELRKSKIKFQLQVCGDGGLAKEFKHYGKLNGFVKSPEDFIDWSDVVFTSSYLSILESMARRRPVVSVYANSLKEDYLKMSKFKNYIMITDSEEDAVGYIKKTINGQSKKLVEEGYVWAKSQTWEKVEELYIKLWKIK